MNAAEILKGKSVVVFDLEIKAEIGKDGVTWDTYDRMGISVGCAFDYQTMDYLVFMDDNIQGLRDLCAGADLVVGFNILGFDIPLLRAHTKAVTGAPGRPEIYDLLKASREATGWREGMRFPTGLKLDHHLEGTFGKQDMKTAAGAEAPLMFQRGEIGRLTSYCLADVKREKMLFEHVMAGNPVTTATHGSKTLALPGFVDRL